MAENAESERSTDMKNEIWSEISTFLNNLRCGDVGRKTYLHFPELEESEKIRKAKKQILRQRWESWMQRRDNK